MLRKETAVVVEVDSQDLSNIVIGKDFDMSALESVTDGSSKKQKEAAKSLLIELKKRILDIQFKTLEREDRLRKATKQLKMHPVMIAIKELQAETKKDKKMIGELMSVYTGALKMTEKVGVKLDSKTLKELREASR